MQAICETVLIINRGKLVANMDAKKENLEEVFVELAKGELTGESEANVK